MTFETEDERRKLLSAAFWMPSVQTMVSRKSSITNALVNAIIPVFPPTLDEIEEALAILDMQPGDVRCAYCGLKATEWDHLRPLVLKHRPTGYVSEIANLVPSCSKCNQSKGNTHWRKWITSPTATHSPTRRGVLDTDKRIQRLEAFEAWRLPKMIDFETVLGKDDWGHYWLLWEAVNSELKKCQDVADALRDRIALSLRKT